MSLSIDNLISSFFFLILVMFGNFLQEIFPAQLNKLLTSNFLIKHIILLFLIYFTLEIVDNENKSPLENLYSSLIIYVFYFFFTKSTLFFSLLIILLLSIDYILIKQQSYLKNKGQNHKNLDNSINIILYIILGTLFVSFVYYFNKQLKEHKDFSVYKFIIGNKISKENK